MFEADAISFELLPFELLFISTTALGTTWVVETINILNEINKKNSSNGHKNRSNEQKKIVQMNQKIVQMNTKIV